MLYKSFLVFLGSGLGGVARYALGGWIQQRWGPTFPIETMLINVSGCLAMGFLAALMTGPVIVREEYRVAVLVGILGGYTTFSTFGRETTALVHDREWTLAALNVVLSNVLGLAAVWAGAAVSNKLYGAGVP
jgi:CrcB protein